MAITVTRQTLVNGSDITVIKCHLVSGAATDVTGQLLVDISTFTYGYNVAKILSIWSSSSDFDMELLWDATTDDKIITLPVGESYFNFEEFGGVINPKSSGYTGDIMFSTRGALADSEGTVILTLKNKS